MATHSSVLAWRIPGTGEPGGLPSMGSHRVGHDWSDLAAAGAASRAKLIKSTYSVIGGDRTFSSLEAEITHNLIIIVNTSSEWTWRERGSQCRILVNEQNQSNVPKAAHEEKPWLCAWTAVRSYQCLSLHQSVVVFSDLQTHEKNKYSELTFYS